MELDYKNKKDVMTRENCKLQLVCLEGQQKLLEIERKGFVTRQLDPEQVANVEIQCNLEGSAFHKVSNS